MLKKRILSLIFALSIAIGLTVCLGSCGEEEPKNIDYTITAVDPTGKAYPDIIVTIFEGTASKGMKPTDKDGVAVFNLLEGDYTFVLTSTGGEIYYDTAECVLSKDKNEVKITIADISQKKMELYNGKTATMLTYGSYGIDLSESELTYILFTTDIAGRYKISVSSSVETSVGNYGAPLNIYDFDISSEEDHENGSLYIDVRTYNVASSEREATPYLLGITSMADTKAIVTIEKVSELELNAQEQPWQEYLVTGIKDWTYDGKSVTDIDITSNDVVVVFNETDGYYHYGTKDGPLVLVKLTTPSKYVSASVQSICESQFFGVYYFGKDGKFTHKVNYQTALLKYIAEAEKEANCGYYPLTEDLKVIFSEMGNYLGWYEPAADGEVNPFFGTLNFVPEKAWLFACCYVQ